MNLFQGHPRSLTMVPIESTYATSYQLLAVMLVASHTILEIPMHTARK